MGNSIMVDPNTLVTAANKMDSLSSDYTSLYSRLFRDVDGLGAAWKGSDNQAFVNRIDPAVNDFKKMVDLLHQYSDYLRQTASTYQSTQSNIASAAGKLGY